MLEDIIVTDSSQPRIKALIDKLNDQFTFKQLRNLEYSLRIEVSQHPDGSLFLSQVKYLRDLLKQIWQKQKDCQLQWSQAWNSQGMALTITVIQISTSP